MAVAEPEIAPTDIAVVGRALRVPGARNVQEFWHNLREGVESIRRLSDEELRAAGVDATLLNDPNYVKVAALLEDMQLFDAGFFGFSPREAAIMDPQHRHFLEVAWEALEDAGHVPESFPGRIGVFGGSGMNAYMPYHLFTNPRLMAASGLFLVRHTGNDKDFLTTRVSYLFDLRGPSVNIQTACSTSLVAIHAACQSLINQESDMALAGGVTIEMPHGHGYLYTEGEILSDDGHCRAFDSRARGTIFGSGAGVVVLRRLEDAIADGDTIYAVIKGSAVNNDGGRKVGYLAPSVDGQAEAVAEALNMAAVPAESITYVECHGTGTPVGDPIEITGLTHAFRSLTDRNGFCAVGSVKTNIGHLDTAAGVASFVKVTEMLRHQTLVPTLHFREANPEVDWTKTPFFVNAQTRPWQLPASASGVRRASINSLGVGGTNAHLVLEEAPTLVTGRASREAAVLLLSARSRASLDRAMKRLADRLENEPGLDLQDVAFTLATGRRRFNERRSLAVASREDAVATLRAGGVRVSTATSNHSGTKVAFLFPGGGAQHPGMAADLYAAEPVFRARVDECLELLRKHENMDLRPLMFPPPGTEAGAKKEMLRPSLALPALLTIELAVAELLGSWGIAPAAMLGHSLGEYAAAHLAGVFSLRDVLSVVACRGRLFETLPEGAMLSVPLPEAEVLPELVPGLSFAASNGPGLSLVSGEVGAIKALEARFAARGVEARKLPITVAAHSQMLDPILGEFERYLRTLRLSEPAMPFVSNVTGTWIRPEEACDPGYWVRHLRQPVRFAEGLSTLVANGSLAMVEVGPGRTLTSLAQAHPAIGPSRPVFQSLRHPQDPVSDMLTLLGAVGRLWSAGVDPDWQAFLGEGRRRVSLPTYSFDHERHWIEPGDGFFLRPSQSTALEKKPDRADWTYRQIWRRAEAQAREPASRCVLLFDDQGGVGRELALELRSAGHSVAFARPGAAFARDGLTFTLRATSREDHGRLLRELAGDNFMPRQVVHLWSVGGDTGDTVAGAMQSCFLPLVALAQALIDEEPSGSLDLVVVTNGAEQAGTDTAPRFPFKALAQGPVRVLPRELPSLGCRSIDLPGENGSPQAAARLLVRELDASPTDVRVALRDADRFVEVYERFPLPAAAEPWPLRAGGVVLITGGLGGISLALAERLARTAKARVVLLGRSGLPAREQWPTLLAQLDQDDPLAGRIQAIKRIEEAGGEALVLAADIADADALRSAIATAEARFGPVNAVIHAAGTIDDGPLHAKQEQGLEAVLRPKVTGAVALIEALGSRPLDFLVLFSSTSAVLGPAGQVDYVAANAFLNAYARYLSQRGIPARAVQWGAWKEVGMAVAALAPVRAAGAARVDHPLLQTRADAASGVTVYAARLDARTQWVLDEHRVRGAEPVLPGTGFMEIMRAALAATATAAPDAAFELSDVSFTTPLVVPEDTPALVQTEVRPDGDGFALTVRSSSRRGAPVEHTAGRGRIVGAWSPASMDVAGIEARCSLRVESFEPGAQSLPQERLLAFGPRWKAVRRVAFGGDEALARLELASAYTGDLDTFRLHPALLDMATGCAFSLITAAKGADSSLVVPLSYGRLRLGGRLPQRLVSHVRLRPGFGEGIGVFDATFADEQGRVVAEIEGYVVKAVEPAVLRGAKKAAPTPLERWVEHGILPDEGFDLLGRVIAQGSEAQMLVSPLDLHGMLAALRAPERPAAAATAATTTGTAAGAAGSGPRDEVERTLAAMWSELLGVDAVRLQDGFFDLGGHSLIAVRLFARIRKAWGVDLPLATLFRAPTLEALAATVREPLGLTLDHPAAAAESPAAPAAPAKADWNPLVPIRKSGSRRPFFCVHGAGGNLLNFRDFVQWLGPEQPVFGLEARGVDGELPPVESIDEAADLYTRAIREAQPHGPYLLGGYSGGGVIALEIAKRLVAAGERVDNVLLLDTFHPGATPCQFSWRERLHGIKVGLKTQGIGFLRLVVDGLITRHIVWARQKKRLARVLALGEPVPHELREMHITTKFLEVLHRHRPSRYEGAVTLFRAVEIAVAYAHVGPRLGWEPHTLPHLRVMEVPGGHDSLVREPNVRILVKGIDEVLQRYN